MTPHSGSRVEAMGTGTPSRDITVLPLTPDRWDDLVELFGPNGAVAGCWCMWFRQTAAEFDRQHGEPNRALMKQLVDSGTVPGLIAYIDGRPRGWCSVAPRKEFGRINRSRILAPVDDRPVWSIVCFFVQRTARGIGLGTALLDAAVAYAASQGAQVVEGYPIDTRDGRATPGAIYVGTAAMFDAAGFEEVARNSSTRPIMRRYIR